ncbi:nucleotide sugar dehydrogenase [Tolypothrix sp. FACHB-123]|uniref:nucleotide sugar dehydrogenase n=1 Tax=Tolypothrix sp. FACHB-123 TaxID=2692868 RepID=UPI001682FB23|nr:nucleotide sugar dehydrogenase [Tolypothrix sp. FACHB-123]MBD2358447.1 nucleotide sugar dehydrogenase [Tolypothrix sp. FACHB-123]
MKDKLIQQIQDKTAVIGIVGLGYVGLPLMLRFVEAGFHVLGFDIDKNKVEQLNKGKSYIKHINQELIFQAQKAEKFVATSDLSRAHEPDVLIMCVPTPLGKHHEPDLSFVINTINSLIPSLRVGQLLSLESTTYPGTTEEEILPRIEKQGFKIGEDIFLVYSAEREDPGNKHFSTQTIPKVVGGTTKSCLEVGVALYESVINKVCPVSSTKVAEMTKLLENIYRAVNISLVNELKIITDRMGIDIWEAIEAAATKPFGFTPFYPGPGLGGHCIPIDPFYLAWKAKEYGINSHFIELAGEINIKMPDWVIGKLVEALNNQGKALKGSKVLVLGIAYKKNIDDTRESPAAELMEILKQKGAIISYSDPHIPVFPQKRDYQFDLKSLEINVDTLSQMDCVLLATDHDQFDYDFIQKNSSLIVDTRGRYRHQYFANVVKA